MNYRDFLEYLDELEEYCGKLLESIKILRTTESLPKWAYKPELDELPGELRPVKAMKQSR